MNVVAVPALALVPTRQAAALLIVAERTGKALRGPARDVLLSGATQDIGHGWGFGLHSIMYQTGAVFQWTSHALRPGRTASRAW